MKKFLIIFCILITIVIFGIFQMFNKFDLTINNDFFQSINITDSEVSFDNLILGKSTFEDVHKTYPDVLLEELDEKESLTLPFFEVNFNFPINANNLDDLEMTKRYLFYNNEQVSFNEDNISNYVFLQNEYENYKDFKIDSIYIQSQKYYSLDDANEILEYIISEAENVLGKADEYSDNNILGASWNLNNDTILVITTQNNTNTYKINISISFKP